MIEYLHALDGPAEAAGLLEPAAEEYVAALRVEEKQPAHWPTLPSKERDKSLGGGIPRYGSARDRGSYGLLAIAFLGAGAADGGW